MSRERKVRSDRKRDIKPTVSIELRDYIYRLSFVTDTAVKNVIEEILQFGSQNKSTLGYISEYFLRDVKVGNSLYIGDAKRVPVGNRTSVGKTVRVSTRVPQDMYNGLEGLAYAMGCSVSRACTLLLEITMQNADFVDGFVFRYIENHIDPARLAELQSILHELNAGNPYKERISWASLLSYFIEEMNGSVGYLRESIADFIIHKWDEK